jgi:hypothetical protein
MAQATAPILDSTVPDMCLKKKARSTGPDELIWSSKFPNFSSNLNYADRSRAWIPLAAEISALSHATSERNEAPSVLTAKEA